MGRWGWLLGLPVLALAGFGQWTQSEARGPGALAPSLRLEVAATVRVGRIVPLKLTVKNSSARPIELALGGRPPHDFVVTKPDGTEVWRWTHGQVIPSILQLRTLQPGEEVKFGAVWRQQDNDGDPVPPGTYLVRGILNTEPPQKLQTEPKRLTIAP